MQTILIILVVLLVIQYVAALMVFIFDSTEKEMRWKMINTKRRFISFTVPFGWVIMIYYYITNLWKELKDN